MHSFHGTGVDIFHHGDFSGRAIVAPRVAPEHAAKVSALEARVHAEDLIEYGAILARSGVAYGRTGKHGTRFSVDTPTGTVRVSRAPFRTAYERQDAMGTAESIMVSTQDLIGFAVHAAKRRLEVYVEHLAHEQVVRLATSLDLI